MSNAATTPSLFISHKHSDSNIADVIRTFVTMHSSGHVTVFQSSSPWGEAPKIGRNLNKELRETLWKTNVVILVYTRPDQDWSYCMWECGVASHPQSPNTKIILFQCSEIAPALFAEQVNVKARDMVSIQRFVDEFLTSSDFFPGFEGPITRFQPHGREVASAAADLFQKLQTVLPPEKEDPSIEWPTSPFLQLELQFDSVERILKASTRERTTLGNRVILKEAYISSADKYCEQMFGVPSFPAGTTLESLVEIWKERQAESDSKWVKSLCSQVLAGVLWQFPPVTWELMQSLNDETWRAPILNRVRKMPHPGCMQFDLYFHRFDLKPGAEAVQIEIPKRIQRKPKKKGTPAEGPDAKKEKAPPGRSRKPRRSTS